MIIQTMVDEVIVVQPWRHRWHVPTGIDTKLWLPRRGFSTFYQDCIQRTSISLCSAQKTSSCWLNC